MKTIAERLKASAPEGIVAEWDRDNSTAKCLDFRTEQQYLSSFHFKESEESRNNGPFVLWAIRWMVAREQELAKKNVGACNTEWQACYNATGKLWSQLTAEAVATALAEVWEAGK